MVTNTTTTLSLSLTHGFAGISAHIGYMIVMITLTFVAAVLSWHLYEKYFLKLSRLFSVR